MGVGYFFITFCIHYYLAVCLSRKLSKLKWNGRPLFDLFPLPVVKKTPVFGPCTIVAIRVHILFPNGRGYNLWEAMELFILVKAEELNKQ